MLIRVVIGLALLALLAGGAYVTLGLGGSLPTPAAPTVAGTAAATRAGTAATPAARVAASGSQIIASAVVTPARSAHLRFSTEGVVAEVLVAAGDAVAAGTPLARLSSRGPRLAVEQARAAQARADAQYTSLLAESTPDQIAAADRWGEPDRGPLTRDELIAAQATLTQARAQLGLQRLPATPKPTDLVGARAQVQQARVALAQAELALAGATLTAPLAGTVVDVSLRVGEAPSPSATAIILADLAAWQITTVDLAERHAVRIQPGDAATVTFDALPEVTLPGRVAQVKLIGENRQGEIVYAATIVPEQPEPRLRWNMTASVTVTVR